MKKALFSFIEVFYNRKRLHASLGYMSPVAYRLMNMTEEAFDEVFKPEEMV